LSLRRDVNVDKVLDDSAYDVKLVNVEQKETKFGDRLMWTFELTKGSSRGEESKVTSSRRKTS
jgi:hypothetical protein